MVKEIIIDEVDVKDCKRRIGKDNFCRYYKRPCSENNYNCIWKKYLRKEQECQQAMDNYVQLDLQRVKEYNELVDLYKIKEQECEELKKDLHQNFKEEDKLNLIIDRLLEASGYDTDTASDEDFEDIYENMRYEKQQLDQLKAENEKLKQTLAEIKEICKFNFTMTTTNLLAKTILQKISECEVGNGN